MKMGAIALAVALVFSSNAAVMAAPAALPLPAGWRLLELSELKNTTNYKDRLGTNGNGLSVEADFNGDGVPDAARILAAKAPGASEGKKFAVYLTFSKEKGYVQQELHPAYSLSEIASYGMAVAPPDIYPTLCGQGLNCESGDAKAVTLTLPGLHVWLYESASSLYYWNAETHSFTHVSTGD
jgi:hypothetical protein